MTRDLEFKRKASRSGRAKSLVVFLHGYGADGADLLGLAEPLGPHLPDTVFIAPDAPERSLGNPFGYQWFPIPRLDGSPEDVAARSFAEAVADLNAFLDARLAEEGLPASALALVGFSQGTMMSLHVAPRRKEQIAGVVGFSGRLLEPGRLAAETLTRPPILLVHGDQDEMVPYSDMGRAADALANAEFEVYTHTSPGVGHGIAPDGLSVALQFLRNVLPV